MAKRRRAKKASKPAPNGAVTIRRVLKAAGPRPTFSAPVEQKRGYAIRFANEMGRCIAADLSPRLPTINATPARTAESVGGTKQLDVNFSTPRLGLALGISLKSVHIGEDKRGKRYTHNRKRNEEELRIEAYGYHKRQPYAVMIGALLLPFDSCDDADPSSFGSWVRHLRPYAGRDEPGGEWDRFEKLYIALYELDGSDLRFFDVEDAPPKRGRPKSSLTYTEFLEAAFHAYLSRNEAEFEWAEGEEDPIDPAGDVEEGD